MKMGHHGTPLGHQNARPHSTNPSGVPRSRKEHIEAFKKYLKIVGYSSSTTGMLPRCVAELLQQNPKPIHQISSEDIIDHYEYLQIRPKKNGTGTLSEQMIAHHIYALRLFFQWKIERGEINHHPLSGLSFPKPTSTPREVLTQQEINSLYQACENISERVLLHIFYGCGLRRSEGEALNKKDIDYPNEVIYVRSGKGKKRRVVPMTRRIAADIKRYVRCQVNKNGKALLVNQAGNRTRGQTHNEQLKKLVKRAGIEKRTASGPRRITLHSLRHSIATHLLASGLSVERVRDFLGHQVLESTQIYTRVGTQNLTADQAGLSLNT